MLFCDNPEDRYYERLMKTVPVLRKKDTSEVPQGTLIMSFLCIGSGESKMVFKSEKHKVRFEETIRKKNKKDYALIAAIYLLAADNRLWHIAETHITKTTIEFGNIKLRGLHEDAYTLFCGAKDLYTGTKQLCIADLSDTDLISPKIFSLICNAIALRRFGLKAIHFSEGGNVRYECGK